jgi:hypothetical protein
MNVSRPESIERLLLLFSMTSQCIGAIRKLIVQPLFSADVVKAMGPISYHISYKEMSRQKYSGTKVLTKPNN